MKLKTLCTVVMSLALGFSAAIAADETPLSKEMSSLNKSLRTLKRQLADPAKKADNLELIAKIKKNVQTAHDMEPKKTKEQPDKAAYVKKYQEEITQLGKTFDELEAAIKADKPDEAKKVLEKLSQEKEKGHKDFGVDED